MNIDALDHEDRVEMLLIEILDALGRPKVARMYMNSLERARKEMSATSAEADRDARGPSTEGRALDCSPQPII